MPDRLIIIERQPAARAERLKAYLEDKAENGTALQKPIYKALLNWYNSLAD